MLQQDQPDDFVIATGVQYSVRDFIDWSAKELGLTLRFEGNGIDEVAIVDSINGTNAPALKVGDIVCRIDSKYFRPAEVKTLLGNPEKAKRILGWKPEITAQEMCAEMIAKDLIAAKSKLALQNKGYL